MTKATPEEQVASMSDETFALYYPGQNRQTIIEFYRFCEANIHLTSVGHCMNAWGAFCHSRAAEMLD